MNTVHLGFEVGTGAPVAIPIGHMVVSGQSQQAGKTTALEALISRSGLRAVAFITKRGEGAFAGGRRIPPYFRERADWQFIEAILESAMRQKMRFERAWIVRASKGALTLAGVRDNVRKLQAKSTRSMDADIYMLLGEYLDLVVPLIAKLPAAPRVEMGPGLNVMDLGRYPGELQALVIRSVLEWVYDHEEGVLTVVPEAWETLPEHRGSPVKLAATALVRKGAALRNFLLIDSQDIAGVSKEIIRQATVWLLGVQREMNEIKRALAHIPAGIKKPRAEDVAQLGRGEFFACFGRTAVKAYVQPEWMDEGEAAAIARGEAEVRTRTAVKGIGDRVIGFTTTRIKAKRKLTTPVPAAPDPAPTTEHEEDDEMASEDLKRIEGKLDQLLGGRDIPAAVVEGSPAGEVDEEALFARFRTRLLKDPAVLKVLATKPELQVHVATTTIEVDGNTLRGRLARLIQEGYFDEVRAGNAAYQELQRKGFGTAKPNVYRELDKLAELGFVTKEDGGYLADKSMKVSIKRAA